MRMLMAAVAILALTSPTLAKDEALIRGPVESGGFGGPILKFSGIGDDFAVFVGGRGGWIINHTLTVGGGGFGLVNEIESDYYVDTYGDHNIVQHMGYGGLILEYVHLSRKLIHPTLAVLVGAGAFGYHYRTWLYDGDVSDEFFVMEPELNVMLNVSEHFRIGLGASYRWVTGTNLVGIDDSDLSNLCGNLTLKFGTF
jgi:hypothetical protein